MLSFKSIEKNNSLEVLFPPLKSKTKQHQGNTNKLVKISLLQELAVGTTAGDTQLFITQAIMFYAWRKDYRRVIKIWGEMRFNL